jgi:hypothetical protein
VRVVTVRDFRDHATELLRSDDIVLVTRDGLPAGFFVPWSAPDLPDDVRRQVYRRLSDLVRQDREGKGVTEEEIQGDFAAWRRSR